MNEPFNRTICACPDCSISCRFIPGMLAPADVPAIAAHLGYSSPVAFVEDKCLASPGALVMKDGQAFRIHTIVPARKPDGSCVFLKDGLCEIHEVSPAGCRFFDSHQNAAEGNQRAGYFLNQIHASEGYRHLWQRLVHLERFAPSPEVSRAKMAAAWKESQAI